MVAVNCWCISDSKPYSLNQLINKYEATIWPKSGFLWYNYVTEIDETYGLKCFKKIKNLISPNEY